MSAQKAVLISSFLFSYCLLESVAALPDLIDLPDALELAPKSSENVKEIKVSKEEVQTETLRALKKEIEQMTGLNKSQQLRLLSLIQEMEGKPDQAYLTFKRIKESDDRIWHSFRELYLSDILGLEEDTHRLSHLITDKLFLKQLKINKVEFCSSVKGFGIYEAMKGSLSYQKPVILYVEVNHLKQVLESGYYKSSCKASIEIKDLSGKAVFDYQYPNSFKYQAKSSLNDYFIWVKWTPLILPGNYVMAFKITDEKANVSDIKEINFEIK